MLKLKLIIAVSFLSLCIIPSLAGAQQVFNQYKDRAKSMNMPPMSVYLLDRLDEHALSTGQSHGDVASNTASRHAHANKAFLDQVSTSVFDTKLNVSEKGAANGVATLDVNANIPAVQLPKLASPLIVYSQAAEPTLQTNQDLAMWIDTDDSNKVYLVFRRGSGDQVKLELL